MTEQIEKYKPKNKIRVVTATSIFDGHDAAINIMRRILQDTAVEVIHLGHNRSVKEIVEAAIQEDVHGIAVSCYQGGHLEFFKYIIDELKEYNASHIRVYGGGGGVIIPEEIRELEEYGVARIFSPDDGVKMGLQGMINLMVEEMDNQVVKKNNFSINALRPENPCLISKLITAFEKAKCEKNKEIDKLHEIIKEKLNDSDKTIPVIGFTGTGGSGKSSLIDELMVRFLNDFKDMRIAIISCDPTRRKTGGALLGDRIRMNSLSNDRIYMRSFATRRSGTEISESLSEGIEVVKAAGFDLVIAETAGIGQADSSVIDMSDLSLYIMTAEFGAASQLEKITMLDYADLIVVNKYEKRGSEDALRDVRKQVQRNKKEFEIAAEDMPVFGTIASRFNDDGVTSLYLEILKLIKEKTGVEYKSKLKKPEKKYSSKKRIIIPPERVRYLSEISETVRTYHKKTEEEADKIRMLWHLRETLNHIKENEKSSGILNKLSDEVEKADKQLNSETKYLIDSWEDLKNKYKKDEFIYKVRDREIRQPLFTESLSHLKIARVAIPGFKDPGEIFRWLREENVPGSFPFTAGVFPLKRTDEDPTRMFAGEGDAARTNRRFKMLSANYEAKRLSTAFDSVTLYGCDPEIRPDIYGKIGTSGVSICTLDDVEVLYGGFDLCSPNTSVSMTINGPAPMMLAMFLNTAIDQKIDQYKENNGTEPSDRDREKIITETLANVRGTVQADILKEDQGQNTCIFSIDFAIKMMGDIQDFFIRKNIRNLYSVSISGYHIAEAGANPITQLALTLANGFTYVEYYLSRGMDIDDFAPNLSFFFSNGMDPEFTVIGRVARRIWAIAMKYKYKGNERSQKLKYHIQTSGRSLHSQEIQFNDIRTTLQALCAIYDNCNSLHTNAFDEAITTPGEESVRRALAIQLIINNEWGLAKNENSEQGSFIVEELTALVEEAVLMEFDKISERGGVLGAMETGYQRSKIQEESMYYEMLKHTGQYPIIGVNTFENPDENDDEIVKLELSRATEDEKKSQLKRLKNFTNRNKNHSEEALKSLKQAALNGGNIFEEMMNTVRYCSIGQISNALFEVGGQYRRNM